MSDTHRRSIAKAISWRITGSLSTFLISFLITGNFVVAGGIATVQIIANTTLYYVHERLWNKVPWGKN